MTIGWIDKHGDVWREGEDGLMHTPETAPFPRAHVEKKWGPLRAHAQLSTGGTLTVELTDHGSEVFADHPDAPADMRHAPVGRLLDGGFQPAPFAAFGLMPETLRAIADLIAMEETAK